MRRRVPGRPTRTFFSGIDLVEAEESNRPLLVGEHTKEILAGMGYAEEQVKTMEEQFAIGFAGMPRMPPRPAPKPGEAPKQGMASMLDKEAKK